MIEIIDKKIDQEKLKEMLETYFPTMVKYVVDIDKNIIAIGGAMHADAVKLLVESLILTPDEIMKTHINNNKNR